MKPFKEVIDGIRKAIMASEVREDIAQGLEYVEQFANTAGENIQKAIDPTLSVSGKAADAAKVGEAVNAETTRAKAAEEENAKGVSQLKEDIDCTKLFLNTSNLQPYTWQQGAYDNGKWILQSSYVSPAYDFECKQNDRISVTYPDILDYFWVEFYTTDKTFVSQTSEQNSNEVLAVAPKNANYYRIGLQLNDGITPDTVKNISIRTNNDYTSLHDALNHNNFYNEPICPDSAKGLSSVFISNPYDNTLEVSIYTNRCLVFDDHKSTVIELGNINNSSFTLDNFDILMYSRSKNSVIKINESQAKETSDYVLLLYNFYGYPYGQWAHYYVNNSLSNKYSSTTQFISRQGEFKDTNENTINAIKIAKVRGYNNIRVSTCFTTDNVGVLSHFDNLSQQNGVTRKDGQTVESVNISSLTYSELTSTYNYFGGDFVTLDEAIELCKNIGIELNIELKSTLKEETANKYFNKIFSIGMNKFVCWVDGNIPALTLLARLISDVNLSFSSHLGKSVIDSLKQVQTNGYKRIDIYDTDDYNEELFTYARKNGIDIGVGTAGTRESLLKWNKYCDVVEVKNIAFPYNEIANAY